MKRNLLENTLVVEAIEPVNNTGAAITGDTVDRLGYQSAILQYHAAAASGSPDTATTALTVQHGDASNMSDAATFYAVETALDIDAAAVDKAYVLDLSGAKRYIRVTADATYTGGSSPANVQAATWVLGDKNVELVDAANNV